MYLISLLDGLFGSVAVMQPATLETIVATDSGNILSQISVRSVSRHCLVLGKR